jgi:hypothetical protein
VARGQADLVLALEIDAFGLATRLGQLAGRFILGRLELWSGPGLMAEHARRRKTGRRVLVGGGLQPTANWLLFPPVWRRQGSPAA